MFNSWDICPLSPGDILVSRSSLATPACLASMTCFDAPIDACIPSGNGQLDAPNAEAEAIQLSKVKTAAILVMELPRLKSALSKRR
ncbi:hypothetical protein EMIT0P100_20330 [Pseudomonas sp. IT-P100]